MTTESLNRPILASNSPHRKEILSSLGIDFVTVPPRIDEIETSACYLMIPFINARRKADCVSKEFPESLILGADTVIEFENRSVGKPRDIRSAVDMLLQFSGKTHRVVTAVCLLRNADMTECLFADVSEIEFKKITEKTIEKYFMGVNPLNKAGGYAIQNDHGMLIERVRGSKSNVVGLPAEKLTIALRSCGLRIKV